MTSSRSPTSRRACAASRDASADLVLAADVLVYVADLAPVLARGRARAGAGRPVRLHGRNPCGRGRRSSARAALRARRGLRARARSQAAGLTLLRMSRTRRPATRTTCRCRDCVVVAASLSDVRLSAGHPGSRPSRPDSLPLAVPPLIPHPPDRRCCRTFRALVRGARLGAARASARTAGEGPRRPLGAADRADRRRQDAGRVSADAGGA